MDGAADSTSIEERLGEALRKSGATVATAESCTGGLIASRITDVPGASDYFDRGVVTYAYDAKRGLLGVTREALDAEGAVSAAVAVEMACRIRDIADTTWGLSATGVAGPGGGTPEKPVGTVYLGVGYAGPWGSETSYAVAEHHSFGGDRQTVKAEAAEAALSLLLDHIQKLE